MIDIRIDSDCKSHTQPWDANLDFTITYTGNRIKCDLMTMSPNDDLRKVLMQLGNAVCKLAEGEEPIPLQIILDDTVDFRTSGSELNGRYPGAVLGTVVHNGEDSKFTKLTASKWQYEIIDIR